MAKEKKEKEKKEKDKKEKKEKDAAEKAEKKEKKNKKKGPPRLPPEFVLGARVEITSHDLASMVSKRGISLGEFKATDTPRKRVRIAVKLEAPLKKGSTVDTSKIEPSASGVARQRVFAGTIDPKEETPTTWVVADDLRALSPPGRADDDAVLKKATGARWWFTKQFGSVTAKILIKGRAWRRVSPTPLKKGGKDGDGGKEESKEEKKKREKEKKAAALAAAVAGEKPEEEEKIPTPKSTEVGKVMHALFEEKRALRIEKVAVIVGGYRTLASVRALTPAEYKRVFGEEAKMKRQELAQLREGVAPVEFEKRAAFPLFCAF